VILAIRLVLTHLRSPYDLVFGITAFPTGQYAVILSRIIRRPVIVQFIDLETVCLADIGYGNLCKPWLKKITIWVSENATALVMVADYQKKIAQESIPISRNIDVLPLRIIPQDFQFIERHITFPVQFIHVAYYSPIKDQHTMFKAFAEVAKKIDCRLTIIGSGFDVPEVQIMLNDLKIADKITFTGPLPYSQIPKQFQHAHILLHTARFETGCAVIQEAMASGVAVCGTRVGILADLGERFGVIVPPKDAAQLASEILLLIEDSSRYKRIVNEAYQWINKYDATWACENYQAFIDGILAKAQSRNS
jgi:glycosyltransferase involved in cell wall biosynthesis